jgi:rRNA-processing protein FCF1
MKILMDADCLIKLTKAGLKEIVVFFCEISIPHEVYTEVVISGKEKGCDDAFVVNKNVSGKKIKLLKNKSSFKKGDDALIELFDKNFYSAVGTDDARLVKRFHTNGIPFVLPAVIIFKMLEAKQIEYQKALWMLDQLSPFISSDEYAMVNALIRRKEHES